MAEESHHQLEMSPSPPVTFDSSSSSTFLQHPAPQLMPIQLTYNNYLLWKSLFIPVLKAYDMLNLAEGREQCPPQFLTSSTTQDKKEGSCENPAYTSWIKRDQMFLTWINASLSPSLLRHTRECTSGQALWVHLENNLAESAKSHVLGLKARLQNLDFRRYWKMEEYLREAREIADGLEAAGSPINDRELTSRIIEGLPEHYDELVASIRNQPHPVTQQELHNLLLWHRIPTPRHIRRKLKIIYFLFCVFTLVIVGLVLSLIIIRYKRMIKNEGQ